MGNKGKARNPSAAIFETKMSFQTINTSYMHMQSIQFITLIEKEDI